MRPALLLSMSVLAFAFASASGASAQQRADDEDDDELSRIGARDRRYDRDDDEDAEDAEIEAYESSLTPTLYVPEFRIRAGGGVGIPLAGSNEVSLRLTQQVEWQPPDLEFLSFGLGGSELVVGGNSIGQVGVRVGGYAAFCHEPGLTCQGAINVQLGAIFGGGVEPSFDLSADLQLRLLIADHFELHVEGGFWTAPGGLSYVDVTAGLGVAF